MPRMTTLVWGLVSSLALLAPPAASANDMPADILLSWVKPGQSAPGGGGRGSIRQVLPAFTDAQGRPFYVNAKDAPGAPAACTADCLKSWAPAVAPADAKPKGLWSIVKREDGTRQWAFRGRPLYTYLKEAEWKDDPYEGDYRELLDMMQPISGQGVDEVWSVASADVGSWLERPANFGVFEVPLGAGQVLITERREPLYVFTGKPGEERDLSPDLQPYRAAILTKGSGDFTVVSRYDGTQQWAYKGKPLYTHAKDYVPGDLAGMYEGKGIEPAYVMRYFMPDGVVAAQDDFRGGRLIDANTGQVLYMRDRHYYGALSFYVRPQTRGKPLVGKTIGVSGCDAGCEREWKPYLAGRKDQAAGYWTIVDRPDGRRQWAYRGYPLYTHPSEPPGSAFGADTWNIKINHLDGADSPPEFSYGLVWRIAVP